MASLWCLSHGERRSLWIMRKYFREWATYRRDLLVQRKYFFFLKQAWRVGALRAYLQRTVFHKVFHALQLNALDQKQKRLRANAKAVQRAQKFAIDVLSHSLQAWETRRWWVELAETLLSRQRRSARVIQSSWRCFARKKALVAALDQWRRNMAFMKHRSAVVVGSFFRMCAAKNRVAAIRAYRTEVQKRRLLLGQKTGAALLVQSLWRRRLAVKNATHYLHHIWMLRKRQSAAAIALQSRWRRWMAAQAASRQRRVMHSAAQMKTVAKSLVAQERLRRLRNARTIQLWWRGWLAKRCHALMLLARAKAAAASSVIQTFARGVIAAHELATRLIGDDRRSRRAIQIQAAARQYFARKELRRRRDAENQLEALRAEQTRLMREEEARAQAQRLQQLCDTEAASWWVASLPHHHSHSLDVRVFPTQGRIRSAMDNNNDDDDDDDNNGSNSNSNNSNSNSNSNNNDDDDDDDDDNNNNSSGNNNNSNNNNSDDDDSASVDGDSNLDSDIQEKPVQKCTLNGRVQVQQSSTPTMNTLVPGGNHWEIEHPPPKATTNLLALPTLVPGSEQPRPLEAAVELPFQDKFADAEAAARRSAEAAAALQTKLRARLLAHVAKEAAQRAASRLCRVKQALKETTAAALLQAFFSQLRKRKRGRVWREAEWRRLRASAVSVQRVWRGVCARRRAFRLVRMICVAQALCQSVLAFSTLRQRRCEKIAAWQRRKNLRAMFDRKEALLDELRRASLPRALSFRRHKLLHRGLRAFASQGSLPSARALRDRWRLRLLETCLKAWRKLTVVECLRSIQRHKKNVLKGLNLRRKRQVQEMDARQKKSIAPRPRSQSCWPVRQTGRSTGSASLRGNAGISDLGGENDLPPHYGLHHINETARTVAPAKYKSDFLRRRVGRRSQASLCWDGELTYTKALTTSYNLRYVTQTKEKVYRAELHSLRQWAPTGRLLAEEALPVANETSNTDRTPHRQGEEADDAM